MTALLTVKEVASLLKCSSKHVADLRDKHRIPCVRLGRLVRYNPEEVMKAIEKLTIKEQGAEESRPIPRSYRRKSEG